MGAVVVLHLWNIDRLHLLVTRRRHFEGRRKVRPQLEAMHPARRVTLRHFLMDDAAPRRHPLDVASRDSAVVTHAIAMLHGSGEHVRDGLDPPVGVPREPRQIVLGNVIAEVVE